MFHKYNLPLYFWAKAINTSCYISNRVFKRPILNKTSYELWNNKKPKISYLRVFGCKCFILNTKDHLGKFDSKVDEGTFLRYSTSSKAYRVFNKRTLVAEESMQVIFDESNSLDPRKDICSVDDDVSELMNLKKKVLASLWILKVQARKIVRRCLNLPWRMIFQRIGNLRKLILKISSSVILQRGNNSF